MPLYTRSEAERSLDRFEARAFGERFSPAPGLTVTLRPAGHILGAAFAEVRSRQTSILFSGDLGRPNDDIMRPPADPVETDYLVIESTYGNRKHDTSDPYEVLGRSIARAAARGGIVMIASFAVGRAQSLLWGIHRLKREGRIPRDLPVFLNSPMATDVTKIYQDHHKEHRLSRAETEAMCRAATIISSVEDSRRLNKSAGPMVIIAGSGMATGGRIIHHLHAFAEDPRNMIVLAGFQAGGTRGAAILGGASSVRIFGDDVPIGAEVVGLDSLSAHADADEIVDWVRRLPHPPRRTFVTHGEPAAADALRARLKRELGWDAHVPEHMERCDLSAGAAS